MAVKNHFRDFFNVSSMTSKNSNYAAESCLTFQHNEYTGLPILDEKGRPKLRDSYLLDTLEFQFHPDNNLT